MNGKIEERMNAGFENTRDTKEEGDGRTWRQAAYLHAVKEILDAEAHRGNVAR